MERFGNAVPEPPRERLPLRQLWRTWRSQSVNRQDVQDGWAHNALVIGKGDKERNVFLWETTPNGRSRAYLEARYDHLAPLFQQHDNRRGKPGPGGEHCDYRCKGSGTW